MGSIYYIFHFISVCCCRIGMVCSVFASVHIWTGSLFRGQEGEMITIHRNKVPNYIECYQPNICETSDFREIEKPETTLKTFRRHCIVLICWSTQLINYECNRPPSNWSVHHMLKHLATLVHPGLCASGGLCEHM